MMPKPGEMRHTAALSRRQHATGDRGQITSSYEIVKPDLPCKFETLSGIELIRAQKREATATHRITMWKTEQIKTSDRLTISNQVIEIRAILDHENTDVVVVVLGSSEVD